MSNVINRINCNKYGDGNISTIQFHAFGSSCLWSMKEVGRVAVLCLPRTGEWKVTENFSHYLLPKSKTGSSLEREKESCIHQHVVPLAQTVQ